MRKIHTCHDGGNIRAADNFDRSEYKFRNVGAIDFGIGTNLTIRELSQGTTSVLDLRNCVRTKGAMLPAGSGCVITRDAIPQLIALLQTAHEAAA